MHKIIFLTAALLLCCEAVKAQTDDTTRQYAAPETDSLSCHIPRLRPVFRDNGADSALLRAEALQPARMLSVPVLFPGYAPWVLHEGFNAQFGLSVSGAWGRHAPKGAGFGEQAAFAYVLPVGKNGLLAAGATAANLDWGGRKYTDVGLSALYAHDIGERLTLYAFLSKRIAGQNDFLPVCLPYVRTPDFSAGAGMNYKLSEKFDIGFSVSVEKYENLRMPVFPRGTGLKDYGSPLW